MIEKPYVLRVAELIYFKIIEIRTQNPEINNLQAFEIFMNTKEYDFISSGEFHDKWFSELNKNNFIDKVTGKKCIECHPLCEKCVNGTEKENCVTCRANLSNVEKTG